MILKIKPIGHFNPGELAFLQSPLSTKFGLKVSITEAIEVPKEAFNPQRHQYLASKILDFLTTFAEEGARVLGIVKVDLYAPSLNFVFGQAMIGGPCALVSLARLNPVFYEGKPSTKLWQERAVKESLHEVGHTFSLRHCPNADCVMFFSNSLSDTDRKPADFCPSCLSKLQRFFKRLPL
jgi:archaemetzincin